MAKATPASIMYVLANMRRVEQFVFCYVINSQRIHVAYYDAYSSRMHCCQQCPLLLVVVVSFISNRTQQ